MPPKNKKEVIFFLTNIGTQPIDGDPYFVEKAKEVMKLITEKKIFMRPTDEIGIMLMGEKDYEQNITRPCTTMLHGSDQPSWKMIENILDIKNTKKRFNGWPKALDETLEQLRKIPAGSNIILILLFDCFASSSPDVEQVDWESWVREIQEMGIHFLWIGSKPLKELPTEEIHDTEILLIKVVNAVKGEYFMIDEALPTLRIFQRPKGRYMAWRCPIEIGNIKIPTKTYVQANEAIKRPSFKTVATTIVDKMEITEVVKPKRDFVDRHRDVHPLSDTIPGFMYGRKFVPVSEADLLGMKSPATSKSFILYGFVSSDCVQLEDIKSNSTRITLPDGPEAEKPFYSLAKAMMETKTVAVIRRIYQSNSEPKMSILIPRIDEPGEPACMVLLELVFDEDRRVVKPQSLNSLIKDIPKETGEIVDNLIDSMMLDDDQFAAGKVPSPGIQHLWNSLSDRAINPHAPVPKMDERLKELLKPPEFIKIKSEPLLKKLKEILPMEKTKDEPEVPQPIERSIPVQTEIEKLENEIAKSLNETTSGTQESCVNLDEIFEADIEF